MRYLFRYVKLNTFLLVASATLLVSPARGEMINSLVGVNFQPYIGAWSGNPLAPSPLQQLYLRRRRCRSPDRQGPRLRLDQDLWRRDESLQRQRR